MAPSQLQIVISGWLDGQFETRALEGVNRWEVHTADKVTVRINDVEVVVHQRPKELGVEKMSVGAATWDGAFVMVAYLAMFPRHRLLGARVVEVGAGTGLPSLFAAKSGAHCFMTDLQKVLPLIDDNILANGLNQRRDGKGYAESRALEWGSPECDSVVESLASPPLDLVIGCDTCYIDPGNDDDGAHGAPRVDPFLKACKDLMGPFTTFLLAFEHRSSTVRDGLLEALNREFHFVAKVPSSMWKTSIDCDHIELYRMSLRRGSCW